MGGGKGRKHKRHEGMDEGKGGGMTDKAREAMERARRSRKEKGGD
jgi:hypothetical protein